MRIGRLRHGGRFREAIDRLVLLRRLDDRQRLFVALRHFLFQSRLVLRGDHARAEQPLFQQRAHARMRGDVAIHRGLRGHGIVGLVVPVTAVAEDVDDHVAFECLAKLQRQFGDKAHRDRVVAVHVEYRGLDHLRHVRAILRRARVGGQRGETDLVVHDEVDCPADAVALELRHVQRLRDHALPGKRGVAVDEHGQHFRALLRVLEDALPRAGHAHDHGVHRFEMARVGREAHHDFATGLRLPRDHVAEVVFHVAVARRGVRHVVLGKLREHQLERFAQKLRDHAEPPAMGHAHADFLHAAPSAIFQQTVERGDERLAALERKAFLPLIFGVQEMLEALDFRQLPQHPYLQIRRHG